MLLSTDSGRQIFVIGHPEYDKYTLDAEYRPGCGPRQGASTFRCNYYPDDDPCQGRRSSAGAPTGIFCITNWLNYYVYQNTPYDLAELQALKSFRKARQG